MKLKKLISKGLLGIMAFMSVSSAGTIVAKANNYGDTSFEGFYSGVNMVSTYWRGKTDDSSAYISNSGSPCGVYVSVWGAIADPVNRAMVDQQDCTYGSPYILVGQGQSKKLLNTVNERKLDSCQLRITGTQMRVTLKGYWSPDSI